MPSSGTRTAPSRIVAACALLALLAAVAPAPGTAAGTPPAADSPTPVADRPCDAADRGRAPTVEGWNWTYRSALGDDSLGDWEGGRIVPVGVAGDCSLAVTGNETATLTAATVDGTGALVTGTLDLGSNGSLRFVAPGGNATTPGLVVANDGPGFAASAVVGSGNRSERVALSSGRFFDVAVRWGENGTARVAVWDAAERWDGEWDVRFGNATVRETRRLRLRGRAFLDAVAVGVPAAPETPSATGPGEEPGSAGETPRPDDTPAFPGPEFEGEPEEPEVEPDPGSGGSKAERGFFGFLLLVGGAVGYRSAYGLTKLGEQLDAIGSTTRAAEVEPADWNVAVTKLVSGAAAVVGLVLLAGAVL